MGRAHVCVCVRVCVYVDGILFSYKNKGNPVICNNIDEPGGHYAKWNKPDRKDKYYVVSLKTKFIERESRLKPSL